MKNAYVLEDHHGDNGTVRTGWILRELTDTRFSALQKRGLIREATKKELDGKKANSPPANKEAQSPSNKGKA
ncbi:hypothetical protein D6851_02555 [Altericroceibacterium spongiae]|uniref:Uncharacterized protein n=1 Tax=Altericroceibacterium spongiae TaxID=2320269 RepID=A0A420ERT1_9SPHN|nr:hypothetical protein [Altericroceibacterium spongiae]RKF23371.1 hypothetical protein D6851_02555 [Altericroceibacterium spongiae]